MVFSRQEYWSGLPSPPPVHLPNLAIEPVSPASQVHSLLLSHQGSPSTGSRSLNLMKNTQLILFTAWLCQLFWRRTLFIFLAVLVERKWVTQSCPTLCNPHWLYSPWNSPGQDTGVVSCCLLQGIFLTQESHQGLLHCRWILYQLSYQGSPSKVYFSTPLPAFILLPSSPQPPLPQEFMVLLHFPMQACSLCSGHILPPPWVPSLHPFLMQTSLPSSQSLPQTHLLKTYLLPVSYSKHSKQQ